MGLNIDIQVTDDAVIIEGSSPDQSIDWGKSKSTVNEIANRLEARFSSESMA